MKKPIRVLLVDDNLSFITAAQDFIQLQKEFLVAGIATQEESAITQAVQLQPDIILLDLNLGDNSGLGLIPLFKEMMPTTKIVILTIMQDKGYRLAAEQAGADAFVLKTDMVWVLFPTLFQVMENEKAEPDNPKG